MRVLIDTTFARRGPSGTATYIRCLIGALRECGVEVFEAANERRRPPAGGGLGSVRNLLADRRWTERELPRHARRLRADVLHHPLPASARRAGCPEVVTVHDLAFLVRPDLFGRPFRVWAARAHRVACQRAGAVVCVSAVTASEVGRRWAIPRDRIVVAHHGPGQFCRGGVDGLDAGIGTWTGSSRHFLYVGDDEPRKNLDLLLEAHRLQRERERASLPLVLAGRADRTGPGLHLEPEPGPERLRELYAEAAALVHPSRYEGFGLTLLEAMATGVPVVTVDSPGAREVCADAPVYVDGEDPQALADQLQRVAGDGRLRRELSERGRVRAAAFSWESAARAHIEAYTLALR
jgi:glycosyltransferase involved in cell wall biosynthesis